MIADNLVVAFQMAGHDSGVHFPELSCSSWSARFTAKARLQQTDDVLGSFHVRREVVACRESGAR